MGGLLNSALENDLKGSLAYLNTTPNPFNLQVHALYNPEINTQYNIVPGLMGVILTMTMIMITGLAITRERERGTMENLLSMPTRPMEVLVGKIVPLYSGRLRAADPDFGHGLFSFRPADYGQRTAFDGVGFCFHRGESRAGHHVFDQSRKTNSRRCRWLSSSFFPRFCFRAISSPFRGMPIWAQAVGENHTSDPFYKDYPRHPA